MGKRPRAEFLDMVSDYPEDFWPLADKAFADWEIGYGCLKNLDRVVAAQLIL